MLYMTEVIGIKPTVWMFAQPLTMFVVHLTASSFLVWGTAIMFLFVDDEISGPVYHLDQIFLKDCTRTEEYIFKVTWQWVNARCTSFCMDNLWTKYDPSSKDRIQDLMKMLSYCFYVPTNVSGPLILYQEFEAGMKK